MGSGDGLSWINWTPAIAHTTAARAIVQSETLYWYLMGLDIALNLIVGLFATGSNIVTIIVLKRMGFSDSTNVSLTALAISDLGSAVTAAMCALSIFLPNIPGAWFTSEIFTVFASQPHLMFSRISALLTTYISVERYLCVWLPLKVKHIITPKRTFVAMVTLFALPFAFNLHLSLSFPVGWKFYPEKNKTLLGLLPVKSQFIVVLDRIRRTLFSVPLPLMTSITVLFCTILLALELYKNKKWRDKNKAAGKMANETSDAESAAMKSKETRAIERVIAITTVFIVSSIPSSIHVMVVLAVPDFSVYGAYSRMYLLTGLGYMLVDSLNCSANVIIYYRMSTKFKHAIRILLCNKAEQIK